MDDLDLTGRLWSQAAAMLRERGFEKEQVQATDITPEHERRGPQQPFAWGELRVVRAHANGARAEVTVAREMKL